ncbi:MAG: zinc ribbon domain-containing protein [Actinobacteria bacterium]|nr:zinc ribbon domain-containing protein [Actinomycetota bacterium]
MSETDIMAFTFILLGALGTLGFYYVYWSAMRRSLQGSGELLEKGDRHEFTVAVRILLGKRLSGNPLYASLPPANDRELYEYFRKWSQGLGKSFWKAFLLSLAVQFAAGIVTISLFVVFSYDTGKPPLAKSLLHQSLFLLACIVSVVAIILLLTLRMNGRMATLRAVDERFRELMNTDQEMPARITPEERHYQECRLHTISSTPFLLTNEDIRATPPSLCEASMLLKSGVAILIGIFIFMLIIALGLAATELLHLSDASFGIFFMLGVVAILVTWTALLIYWEVKRQRKSGRKPGLRSVKAEIAGYPDPLFPRFEDFSSVRNPYPARHEEITCPQCGARISGSNRFCIRCGVMLPRS